MILQVDKHAFEKAIKIIFTNKKVRISK